MTHTVVHLFAGSGGCTLGFQRAGFRSLGSFDFDARACRDLERLTGGPAFCRDLAAMQPAEMRALTGACPDVVVMSPPSRLGTVVGEAPLVRVEPNPRGGARWVFGALVRYLVPPPHTPRRRSPWAEMPVCPLGTLTPATAPMW